MLRTSALESLWASRMRSVNSCVALQLPPTLIRFTAHVREPLWNQADHSSPVYSIYPTCWTIKKSRFDFCQTIIFFLSDSRTPLGPTQPPIQLVSRGVYIGISCRSLKLTTHINLVSRIIHVAIPRRPPYVVILRYLIDCWDRQNIPNIKSN
jgi:hypothetical protein